MFPLFVSG